MRNLKMGRLINLHFSVYKAEDSRVMIVNDREKNEVDVNGGNPEICNVSFPAGKGIPIPTAINGIGRMGIGLARQPGVRHSKSGKWTAEIKRRGKGLYLGTYNTFEEAAQAYNMKRRELDLMAVSRKEQRQSEISLLSNESVHRLGCKPPTLAFGAQNQVVTVANGHDSEAGNASGENQKAHNSSLSKGFVVEISVPTATNSRDGGMARHPGVRQRKSGRWEAKINRRGRNVHLGTFDTLEEAANAFNQKRLEFDSAVGSKMQGRTSQVSVVSKISKSGSAYASPTSVLATEASPDAVVNVHESEGRGANGGKQQTPNFSSEIAQGLDLGIVNPYGQLVGDYSRLDDELWFCKPEDDEATTWCNDGFAWDP
ncbi:hypothetical protein Ancab_018496 [Ancistrocladus abbreviatus]